MFCPKCGTRLNEDMTCPNCGTQVHTDEKSSNHQKRVIRKLSEDEVKVGYPSDKPEDLTEELKEDVIEAADMSELNDMFSQATTDESEDMMTDISNHLENMDAETGMQKDMLVEEETGNSASVENDSFSDDRLSENNSFSNDMLPENNSYSTAQHSTHGNARQQRNGKSGNKSGKQKSGRYGRRAGYDRFADDDYDGTIDDTSAQEMYQRENKNRKKSKGFGIVVAVGVILIAVVIVICISILFTWYRGRRLSEFEAACDAYAAAIQENDANYGEYSDLYDKAMKALQDKDYNSFRDLMNQMTSLTEQMKDVAGNLQSLEDIKTHYTNELDKYVITEEYEATYNELMNRLDTAISQRKEESVSDLKKEFESLEINLKTSNQQLVQTKRNEINKLDIAGVADNVKSVLSDYETQVDAALQDNDYKEAVRVLDSWMEFAQSAEQELRAKESEERERLESESRARESEEAARQSESEVVTDADGYLLAGSDTRYVTADEVTALSAAQRRLARNEIYARHGRMFNDAEVQKYFNNQPWYTGTIQPQDFDEGVLNEFEKANINLIASLE